MVARQREIMNRCLGWQPRRPIEGGDVPLWGVPVHPLRRGGKAAWGVGVRAFVRLLPYTLQ